MGLYARVCLTIGHSTHPYTYMPMHALTHANNVGAGAQDEGEDADGEGDAQLGADADADANM